jgi:PilZ domain
LNKERIHMAERNDKRRNIRTPLTCAVYYSDGAFHASGMTENMTESGGCLRGSHSVTVGMELTVLLIPPAQRALMIKKATVRWVDDQLFGVELDRQGCGPVGELDLDDENFVGRRGHLSFITH